MKKRKVILISVAVLAAALAIWTFITNITVGLTRYTVCFSSLPEQFDGFRIAQVSDFHNADFWGAEDAVINAVKEVKPDIIAITGDLVDSTYPNVEVSLSLAGRLSEIAPCYYITGNHEAWIGDDNFKRLTEGLSECGVTILRDSTAVLQKNGAELLIAGIDDPVMSYGIDNIPQIVGNDERFTVLLSHRPEYYEVYKSSGVQLVLSGHAHGGQFRLPFLGGLYAPHQGMLPEYDCGIYQDGDFALAVSRGIGNSVFPVRFNNQPEVVAVELRRAD